MPCVYWLLSNAECEDDPAQEAVAVNIIDDPFPVQLALNVDQTIPLHVCEVHGHQGGRVVDLKKRKMHSVQSRKAGKAPLCLVNTLSASPLWGSSVLFPMPIITPSTKAKPPAVQAVAVRNSCCCSTALCQLPALQGFWHSCH